jgi:hypothetical protein
MVPRGTGILAALLTVCLGVMACGDASFQPGVPLDGAWGAEHLSLIADGQGAALEYDCATGAIDDPLVPDAEGRFDLTGTHTLEHGGPVQVGEDPDIHPARYEGRIVGRTLTLTVTLTDTGDAVGTFALVKGQDGRVYKCL